MFVEHAACCRLWLRNCLHQQALKVVAFIVDDLVLCDSRPWSLLQL